MLTLGVQQQRTCQGWSRREIVQVGLCTALGLNLADWLRVQQARAASPLRARSVIMLWLWGGPSHLDTFDPKPQAPLEYRGPFGTIPTSIPGLRFCELFPQLARLANRCTLIRSLQTRSNDHGVA